MRFKFAERSIGRHFATGAAGVKQGFCAREHFGDGLTFPSKLSLSLKRFLLWQKNIGS
jgi:hypothetical protein